MDIKKFIEDYRQGFGLNAQLPLVFWYSQTPALEPTKLPRCYISALKNVIDGEMLTLNEDNALCPGAKLYSGFALMQPNLPKFISGKELYKKDEILCEEMMSQFSNAEMKGKYLNFARIDKVDSLENKEGVIFFATPDILSGLVAWCHFDTNAPDAVCVPFGSGCSVITAQVVQENKLGGKRTFLGMFDPSARPCVEDNILTYSIPINRFEEMCETISETFLIKTTNDWQIVKNRINGE